MLKRPARGKSVEVVGSSMVVARPGAPLRAWQVTGRPATSAPVSGCGPSDPGHRSIFKKNEKI